MLRFSINIEPYDIKKIRKKERKEGLTDGRKEGMEVGRKESRQEGWKERKKKTEQELNYLNIHENSGDFM